MLGPLLLGAPTLGLLLQAGVALSPLLTLVLCPLPLGLLTLLLQAPRQEEMSVAYALYLPLVPVMAVVVATVLQVGAAADPLHVAVPLLQGPTPLRLLHQQRAEKG